MKITRFVRMQLTIFAIVTTIALIIMAVFYIRIPAMVGIGVFHVNLKMPTTGGLYQNANVSFRGVDVGKVESVRLDGDGVIADLRIDSGTDIPSDATAAVRSMSAVGEQFVVFEPPVDDDSTDYLRGGDTVYSDDVPVEISSMLDQAQGLLDDIGDTRLRALMDEAFTAFNGTGEELQRLLDSMILFVKAANENSDAVVDLIDQAGPLLATQTATADAVRAWTADVTAVTDQMRANLPEITDILVEGPGVASSAEGLFSAIDATMPLMFSNLAVASRTLALYLPNLRQVVVLYPRVMQALIGAVNTGSSEWGPNVSFTLGFQDPPVCTVGFLPPEQWRWPSVQEPQELPPGMLCRLPQDANIAVRGSRNFPCVEFPGRRAPTPEECRTGYVPEADTVEAFPDGLPFGLEVPPGLAGDMVEATPSSYAADGGPGNPAVYATSYDPVSGDFIGPDGNLYNVDPGDSVATTQASSGSGSSWQRMIERTVAP